MSDFHEEIFHQAMTSTGAYEALDFPHFINCGHYYFEVVSILLSENFQCFNFLFFQPVRLHILSFKVND